MLLPSRFRPVALLTLASVGLAAQAPAQTIQFTTSDIAVYNYVGTLRVIGSSAPQAEAVVVLRGADANTLTISHEMVRGREVLQLQYPDRVIRPPANARRGNMSTMVSRDGTWGWDDGTGQGSRDRTRTRRVEVRDSRDALDAFADIELRVPSGHSARVYLLAGEVTVQNIDGELRVDVGAANITSRNTRGGLWLDTGSGDVQVSGVEGDLHLDTGSGDVTVDNANGDDLDADTGSGDVRLHNVRYRSGRFDTGSGRVELTAATVDNVSLDTGSGDMLAEFARTPSSVTADAGSGDITIGLPDNASLRVAIAARRSQITSEFPIEISRQSRDELRGTIGAGEGRLTVDTGSGRVRLRKLP